MKKTFVRIGRGQPLNKKAFTLIELLAVIVILAIIALIATPIILNIISDSKEESRERSIDNIIHTARIYAAKEGLEQNKAVHIKDIKNMIDGEVPENGIIYFDKNGEVAFSLDFEDEVYVKSFEGEIEKETESYYLKIATTTNGKDQLFFENPYNITKEQIEKVTMVPKKEVPSDADGSWDVSNVEGSGKVMAWYYEIKKEDGTSYDPKQYEIYIGQDGGVKANQDSTKLFNYLVNVKQIDLTYLNAEYVTYMTGMFQRCGILERIIGLENFDTSNVTIMYGMFNQCENLTELNLNNFDTSKVTNMQQMFQGCSSLTTLDLSNFNTSQVTNMRAMISNCLGLKEIDVSNFETSNVTTMYSMFAGTTTDEGVKQYMQLERIKGLENFDTSNVTDMSGMFQNCMNLKEIDVSGFITSKVTNMSHMFNGCSVLKTLNISNFDTSKIGTGSSKDPGSTRTMFQNCTNLSTIYVTKEKWVRNTTFDIENMFNNTNAVVKDINTNEIIAW